MDEHARILMLLAAYRDLSPRERAEIERHLAACPRCAQRGAEYRAMDQRLAAHVAADPTPRLTSRPTALSRTATRRGMAVPPILRGAMSLAAAGMLALLLIWMLSPKGNGPASPVAVEATPDSSAATGSTPVQHAATATGGVEKGTATAAPPTVAPTPKALTLCMASEPRSLDPAESAYVSLVVREIIQPPLIAIRHFETVPVLVEALPSAEAGTLTVEEVTLSEGDRFFDAASGQVLTLTNGMTATATLDQSDGTQRTLVGWQGEPLTTVRVTARWTLVEGLAWEDGQPVTADDLLYAFDLDKALRASATPVVGAEPQPALRDLAATLTAVGERTVEWVGIPGAQPPAEDLLRPQPRHAYAGISNPATSDHLMRSPLSYGPYRLTEWVAGEGMTLLPNPHVRGGPPPLATLSVRFLMQEVDQVTAQLLGGGCDIATMDFAWEAQYPLLESFAERQQLSVFKLPTPMFEHLSFNLASVEGYSGAAATLQASDGAPLFQHVEFRRAIAQCLDRDALIEQALDGAAFVTASYLSEDHPAFPAEGIAFPAFDPAQGQAQLDALGWADRDGDGVREDGAGTPLVLRYDTRENPLREKTSAIVAQQLRDNCGVALEVGLHGSEFFESSADALLFGRRFDLAEFAWFSGVLPACALYTSDTVPSEANQWSGNNVTGFRDADYDAACADLSDAEAQGRAAQLIAEQLPMIPLLRRAQISVARPDVIGFAPDATANAETWNVEEWDVGTVER